MGKLKCYFFWMILLFYTLVALALSPFYIIVATLFWRKPQYAVRTAIYYYAKIFIKLVSPIIPLHVENANTAKQNSPCIIVANHQSFLDLYYIAAQNSRNVCIIVGGWPFRKLPFFAPFMRFAGYIEAKGKSSQNLAVRCKTLLASGCTIVCFPEGRRSRDGALQKFYSGIFRVAIEANVPIVPMIFYNTGKVCPPGSFFIKPQKVRIKILDPVYPYDVKFLNKSHIALKNIAFNNIQCALALKS